VLFEIVSEYGFNADQVKDIVMSLGGISGKQFYSATHRITKASQSLIIEELNDSEFIEYAINIGDKNLVTSHHTWYFEVSQNKSISKLTNEAVLDLSKLSFPLIVRKWKQGDKMRPIGMQGHKKVSDILIDKKLSVPEKEKVWVLVSGEEIVWINELVVCEDYKVTSETTSVLRVESLGI
jgi:tRNA(Ile)-lysidine synthase